MVKANEAKKAEFTEYEKQDIRCREDLKHAQAKVKKLEKNLKDEAKKVGGKNYVILICVFLLP